MITNCNKCSKLIKNDEIFHDYDHEYYCKKCYLKNELKDTIRECAEKEQWLKKTHLKHLIKLQKRISVLRKEIELLQ